MNTTVISRNTIAKSTFGFRNLNFQGQCVPVSVWMSFHCVKQSDNYDSKCFLKNRNDNRTLPLRHFNWKSNVKPSQATATQNKLEQKFAICERFIYVSTNVDRWHEFPGGIVFDVKYLDTSDEMGVRNNAPVILFVHSNPGTSEDLRSIMEPLAKMGCRVLAASFPGNQLLQ